MAKDDTLFNLEWDGLEELADEFEQMEEEFEKIAVEEYTLYGQLVEEGTKALSHHDEGDLEESISFDKAESKGDDIFVEGGASAKHALRRHEEPYREGKHPKYENGSKFEDYYVDGLGEGTRAKPNWRGEKPGRKYMARAISATEEDYNAMNNRILDRTYGDRK